MRFDFVIWVGVAISACAMLGIAYANHLFSPAVMYVVSFSAAIAVVVLFIWAYARWVRERRHVEHDSVYVTHVV